MKNSGYISDAVIRRLPRYYRHLGLLLEQGVERISSKDFAKRLGLTASQVRQDLNNFGDFGQQGYGYNIRDLYKSIEDILGLSVKKNVIIMGAGNMGHALAKYPNFERRGFKVNALFDINPELIGQKVNELIIYSMDSLEEYCREHKPDIAVISLPKAKAQEVASRLVACGVRNFWNFASADLSFNNPGIIVENVHLTDSLMTLSYRIKQNEEDNQ